jgi:hypothetical protein
MKRTCYYHVYLSDDLGTWSHMVLETMKAMEDSGLLSALNKIKVTCVTQYDGREKLFSYLMSSDWHTPAPLDIEIEFVRNPWVNDQEMLANIEDDRTVTENYTYRKIWNDAWSKPDSQILYVHTKGITATDNLLRKGNAEGFKRYYYWRQYLQWGVIENWKKCVDALMNHDVAGVNYYEEPTPHYSGSYWWANSSYVETLPDPAEKSWWYALQCETPDQWLKTCSDRFRDEMWLCSRGPRKVFNLHELPQKFNPAAVTLPRGFYE